MHRTMVKSLLLTALAATIAFSQEPTPTALDKLDAKKIATALRPKGSAKEVLAVIGDRDGRYDNIAFRHDGAQMAISGPDGQVRLWDLTTLRMTGSAAHKEVVCLTFSPSGKALIAGDSQGNLKYWSIANGKLSPSTTLIAHKGQPLWAIDFTPDGKTLITAGGDSLAKVWDGTKNPPVLKATLAGHTERIRHFAISRDGLLLATVSDRDKTVRIWDLVEKPKERTKLMPKAAPRCVSFAPDGKTLAVGCSDGVVRAWTIGEKVEEADDIRGGPGAIATLEFSPDGKTILGRVKWDGLEDRAFLWNRKGEILHETRYSRHIEAAAFDPGGRHVVIVHETSIFIVRLPE